MPIPVDQKRSEQIKKYFGGSGRVLPWILIAAGVPLLLVFGIGLVLIGIGIFMLTRRSAPVEDAKIDAWIQEIWGYHDYEARAKEMSGFSDLVRPPIVLQGYAGAELSDGAFVGERSGDDGLIRSTPISATVILATQDQLGIYRTGVDLVTGNRVNEQFLEVFYQDVVAVSVGKDSHYMDLGEAQKAVSMKNMSAEELQRGFSKAKMRKNLEKFRARYRDTIVADVLQRDARREYKIEFVDGHYVPIAIFDGRPSAHANAQPFIESDDETAQAMHALRMFVRDKKRGFLRKEIAG